MSNIDRRTRERAEELWREAGSPAGGSDAYVGRARELIAIEDNPHLATKPVPHDSETGPDNPPAASDETSGPTGEPVEPLEEAVENEGEFPTLTDQGEEETAPHRRKRHAR
jgi:hypothetical protein